MREGYNLTPETDQLQDADTYIRKLRTILPVLQKKYPISYLGIFGSYIRDEQTPDSDLDLLVEFDKPIGLLDYARLEIEISDSLGIKADLVSRTALKPGIGKHILSEVVQI